MKKENKKLITGLAVGALAGAIAGVLLAPQSGKQTREDIAKYMKEMKEKIAKELVKAGNFTKEKYHEIAGKVVDLYETSKKISKEDAKEIKGMLEDNYEDVKKIAHKE